MIFWIANGEQTGGWIYGVAASAAHSGTWRWENDVAYYCHFRMYQRAFGNIFAAVFNVPKEVVTWERGQPAYFYSSRIARRGFCRECGTPLTFEYLASPRLDLSGAAWMSTEA